VSVLWEERVYAVLVSLHQRAFRTKYGEEMKLMLNDMLKDPNTPRWRVWLAMLDDAGNLMGGGVKVGIAGGLVVIAVWLVHRLTVMDAWFTFLLIAATYISVGFVGARRAGFILGMGSGIIAGALSVLTFGGDGILFGRSWELSRQFIFILMVATTEGMALVLLGATIARFGDIQRRVRRSAAAFGSAWMAG